MINYFRDLTDDELKKCYFDRIRMIKEKDEKYSYTKYENIFKKYMDNISETTRARAIMNGHMDSEIAHRWIHIVSKGYYFGDE